MPRDLDDLDRRLLAILQRDAMMHITNIAKELGQPDSTIRFRTKKLKERNIVNRFSALVRPEALGFTTSGIFRIEVGGHILPEISRDRTKTFAEELAADEQYLWIAVEEEPMVIHALVMATDDEDLETRAETLRKSPDIVNVTVTKISSVVKGWEISGHPE
jgi:DNA-binding Lrp family transcriptional regulator